MSEIVKARYEAFGCAGQASKIKVIGLEAMACGMHLVSLILGFPENVSGVSGHSSPDLLSVG